MTVPMGLATMMLESNEVDLRGADLRKADLRGLTLSGVNLEGADLAEARLSGAELIGSSLKSANLEKADCTNAILYGSILTEAILTAANLSASRLRWAHLERAQLKDASLEATDLSEAYLSGAILTGADLRDTMFIATRLDGAHFENARISSTKFSGVDLTNTQGLDACRYSGNSSIDHRTLTLSQNLPLTFLRGCGLPERLITYLPSILDQAVQFYSCFISYNHADKSFARRLHDALQGRGIRCWLDEKQLLPGDDIHDAVDRGIRLWDKVLLCCSAKSLTSWWVDNEISKAFAKEQAIMKARKKRTLVLIPMDLDGYLFSSAWESGKASQVRERLVADFTGWESENRKFEIQVERVIQALRADDGAYEAPPPEKL
jgi:hypothetical protein